MSPMRCGVASLNAGCSGSSKLKSPNKCAKCLLGSLSTVAGETYWCATWQLVEDFGAMRLHPFARCTLNMCGNMPERQLLRLHIYTDGSCKDGSTPWTFVVIGEYSRGSNKMSRSVMDQVRPWEIERGLVCHARLRLERGHCKTASASMKLM